MNVHIAEDYEVAVVDDDHFQQTLEFPVECIVSAVRAVDGDDEGPNATQSEHHGQKFESPRIKIKVQLPVLKGITEDERNSTAPSRTISRYLFIYTMSAVE